MLFNSFFFLSIFRYKHIHTYRAKPTILIVKIGKGIPELLAKSQLRPCTFPQAKLVLNYQFWSLLRPLARFAVHAVSLVPTDRMKIPN